ncbi:Endoplasmic reticulum aminopeptidase 2, partial [Stegodyphus mimosarum]
MRFEQLYVLMQNSPLLYSLFQKYMVKLLKPTVNTLGWEDKGNHMEKKLRSIALAASVYYGDEQTISRAKQIYQNWMQNGEKYLNYSMNTSKIRSQDRFTAISVASNNPIGRSITWKFVQEHWPLFLRIYGRSPFAMTIIITETTSHFNTQSEYNEAKAFFSEENVGSGTEGLKTSLMMIKSNIKWREEAEAFLTQWLQQTVN